MNTFQLINLVDLGNLILGFGTFFLGIVVLYINTKNSNRDRRIHLADKRQQWIVEFRSTIVELLIEMEKVNSSIDNTSEQSSKYEDEISLPLIKKLHEITLLVDSFNDKSADLLDEIGASISLIKNDRVQFLNNIPKILILSKELIHHEWEKIKTLSN
ncbi:hypothetical protein [Aquimarina sp. 2201CG14-23]|uniref:hypothetical protein n=1 Tax=Aquimarina mycalae TaxID=3040073 RepID=UPI002477E00A|nr:hypothetical protein [Aquimarina sp. 2201CG14-23]MDH7444647.1 hypothetical protein [Aquimarina sp. 2201CG14-23]